MAVKKQNKVQLVVVGSIGIDTIQTPFDRREEVLGGSVSYACASAALYASTGVVGVVGEDFSDTYIELYRQCGINLDGLQKLPGKTFRWSGVYEDDMINRRTLLTELNVFAEFMPVLPDSYKAAPYVLLGNIAPDLQLHVLDQIESPLFVVADTMDLWMSTAIDSLMKVIKRIDLLTLNDSEVRQLTGERNLYKAAHAVLDMGPRYVIVKKGEHGSMLVSRDGVFMVPAFPVAELKDPTGAGDAFAGGFMGYLASKRAINEKNLRKALLYATVTASFAVEDFTLERLEKISKEDVDERMRSFKQMVFVR